MGQPTAPTPHCSVLPAAVAFAPFEPNGSSPSELALRRPSDARVSSNGRDPSLGHALAPKRRHSYMKPFTLVALAALAVSACSDATAPGADAVPRERVVAGRLTQGIPDQYIVILK